ncbi:Rho guanine nucleotide exchange factor 10-like [Oopsacas minuta]|uniref:Rho guanine nucleotide exchange factor 10-like n=1 Tax=Oopsacas minuta TaxID=111878 RepID=A0AAV7KBP2_9METZ|nr:Rho guanine nucleotide exchange factor 10-like [Oopsacas minuta]
MTTKAKVLQKRERGKKFLSYILSRTSDTSHDLPIDPNEVETSDRDNLGRAMSVPILSIETKRKLSESKLTQSLSKYDLNPGSDSENDLDLVSMSGEANYIDLNSIQDKVFKRSMHITKAIVKKSKWEIREFSDSIKFPEFDEDIVSIPSEENVNCDITMSEETTQLVRRRIRTSVSLTRPSKIPPLPKSATQKDRNRVRIIQEIINTEIDYMKCLRKLIQLRDTILANVAIYGLTEEQVNRIFAFLPDILESHELFYMSISGKVLQISQDFDIRNLQLGPDCISAFSKEIVAISYSKYSAQFSSTIDTIIQHKLSNEQFSICLRKFEAESKESLKTALIRPIQIFPKYVHIISELLRFTDPSHPDYCSLSYALTGLESMAIRLGVVRHEAELKEQFLQLQSRIISIRKDFFRSQSRKLLRIEPAIKLSRKDGYLKPKFRYLFIFNDHIMCLRGAKRTFTTDMLTPGPDDCTTLLSQYFIEWSIPIDSIEVKVREKSENLRIFREITKILNEEQTQKRHDVNLLQKIDLLVTQLYGVYLGFSKANVQNCIAQLTRELRTDEIYTSLQRSHAIDVELIRGSRIKRYIFYLGTIETIKEFVLTFHYAKMRVLPENFQGWLTFAVDSDHKLKSIQNFPLLADTQVYNTMYANCSVNCATIVADSFIWLCCGNLRLGIIMILNTSGKYIEKIVQSKACTERISVIQYMPPFQDDRTEWMYPTVWMGTENGTLYVYDASDPTVIDLNVETECPDSVVSMISFDGRMFIGLANGDLMVFDTDSNGEWDGICRCKSHLSEYSIISMHLIDSQLWCFSGNNAILFSLVDLQIEEIVSINNEPNQHVMLTAPFGRAIWLCLKQEPELLLFHIKHKEVLQTISLNRFFRQLRKEDWIGTETVRITSLLATHGSLWVGTSEGIVVNYELHDGIPVFVGQTSISQDSHNETAKQFLYLSKNIGQRQTPKYQKPKQHSELLELEDGYWTQLQPMEPSSKRTSINSTFEASNILLDGNLKLTRVGSDPVQKDEPILHDFTSPLNTKRSISQINSFPPKKFEFPKKSDPSIYDNTFKPSEETIHEQSFEDSATYELIPAHLNMPLERQISSFSVSSTEEQGPKFIPGGMPPPKPPRKSFSVGSLTEADIETGTIPETTEIEGPKKSKIRTENSSDLEVLPRQISTEYSQSSLEGSSSPVTETETKPTVPNPGSKSVRYVKATFLKPINKTKLEPLSSVPEPNTIDLLDPANTERIWNMVDDIKIDPEENYRDPYVIMTSPRKETGTNLPEPISPPFSTRQEQAKTESNSISNMTPKIGVGDYSKVKRNMELTDDFEQVPAMTPPTKNEYFVLSSKDHHSVTNPSKLSNIELAKVSNSFAYDSLLESRSHNSGDYTKLQSHGIIDDIPDYEKLILDSNGRPISLSPQKKIPIKRVSSDSEAIGSNNTKDRLGERESAWIDIHLESYYVLSIGNGYFDWREVKTKPTNEGSMNPTVLLWQLPCLYNV